MPLSTQRCPHGTRVPLRRGATRSCAASSEDLHANAELLAKARKLLEDDPKAVAALERLNAAAEKVEALQHRQAQLPNDEAAAALEVEKVARLQEIEQNNRVMEAAADAKDVEVLAARNQLELAELQGRLLQSEKAALLSELKQSAERVESVKTAGVAILGGLIGILPTGLSMAQQPLPVVALSAGGAAATCALFGIIYRYVTAADRENLQLRGGAVMGFGLARGIALVSASLTAAQSVSLDDAAMAAVLVGQSLLTVAFAAAAVEFAFQRGLCVPFGLLTVEEGLE